MKTATPTLNLRTLFNVPEGAFIDFNVKVLPIPISSFKWLPCGRHGGRPARHSSLVTLPPLCAILRFAVASPGGPGSVLAAEWRLCKKRSPWAALPRAGCPRSQGITLRPTRRAALPRAGCPRSQGGCRQLGTRNWELPLVTPKWWTTLRPRHRNWLLATLAHFRH